MDKLYSKEQIEEWASKRADDAGRLSRQLLDTMRENERLRDALGDLHSLYAETDRTLNPIEVCGEVQELLYGNSNKDSDNG